MGGLYCILVLHYIYSIVGGEGQEEVEYIIFNDNYYYYYTTSGIEVPSLLYSRCRIVGRRRRIFTVDDCLADREGYNGRE